MKKILVSLVVLTMVLGLSACASGGLTSKLASWNTHAKEKRQFQVRTLWVRRGTLEDNLGFRKINRMTPIIAGSLLIQGNGIDGMTAYNRDTGEELWRLPIPNGVEGNATLINDRLFFGANDGNFYSIEASTGRSVWSFSTKSENLGEPLLDDGIVYFLSGNNAIYALDAATGKQLWLHSRQDTSSFSIRGGSKPVVKNGKLYVGFSDGSLVAFNAKTGVPAWEILLNKNKKFRDIDASPVVDGDNIYIAGYDDKLYSISAETGEILWRIDSGGYSAVTLIGDSIIYPTSTGEVLALKKSNGDLIWKYKSNAGIATQVRVFKGMLVFGESQGKLLFLNANSGKIIGGMEPGRGILSAPQIDEKKNSVYFISGEANVYAIEAKWDKPNWYTQGWE